MPRKRGYAEYGEPLENYTVNYFRSDIRWLRKNYGKHAARILRKLLREFRRKIESD